MESIEKKGITDSERTSRRPVFRGVVVSAKSKDTAIIEVQSFKKHSKYQKFIKRSKRYKVHDAGNTLKDGETAFFEECRPISKDKRFRGLTGETK